MMAEIGHFLLAMALVLSLIQGGAGIVAIRQQSTGWIHVVQRAGWGQFFCLITAFAILISLFMQSDFSVALVAQHSNSRLPNLYKFAATWGNHEGSMLMWITLLGFFSALLCRKGGLSRPLMLRAATLHGWLCFGFIVYTLFLSDPFTRLTPPAINGADLNPLLQHPAMAFHPPFLYFGYTGFSIAFVLALAALWQGKMDRAWARQARIWTLAAWSSLSWGIAMGSWWAYYELGWGGFWFWDPVENSALIPWLSGAALLHCLITLEQRGALRHWSAALAMITFALCLCGAFLVRSGVLVSVHSFAIAPQRGLFLLLLLGVYVGAAFSFTIARMAAIKERTTDPIHPVSRENAMLVNNVLLGALAASILLGTIYPILLEGWNGEKITVAAPFFNTIGALFLIPLAAAMGIGPSLRWKRDELSRIAPRMAILALVTAIIAVGILWRFPTMTWTVAIAILCGLWIGAATLASYRAKIIQGGMSWRKGIARLPPSTHAMTIAHFSVALLVISVAISGFGRMEKTLYLEKGQSVSFAGYRIALDDVRQTRAANYITRQARLFLYRHDNAIATLYPEKRFYTAVRVSTSEAAVYSTPAGDLYIAIDDDALSTTLSSSESPRWVLRLWFNPMMIWIWISALGLVCAGILSLVACLRRPLP